MLVNPNQIYTPSLYLPGRGAMTQENMYAALEAYYYSSGLYDQMLSQLHSIDVWTPAMKSLRTPAHRSVEFYASHLWPGNLPDALPIAGENEALEKAIHRIWEWSAWGAAKQRAARWFALLGNMFLCVRVSVDKTKVFLQPVKPSEVTWFECDYRGFVTRIRMDKDIQLGAEQEPALHTEYYDKTVYQVWEGTHDRSDALEDLGAPMQSWELMRDFGIDFVPVVHAKFYDAGDKLGNSCFVHALDKIDEANRQATRLHQLLFRYNKPAMIVSANATGPEGQPLPAPRLSGGNLSAPAMGPRQEVESTDEDIHYLPGMSTMASMIPAIAWGDALKILEAMCTEIRRDLPELLFYDLSERTDLSGKAIRALLSGAIARCVEARGMAESALVRADQIAITIGQFLQLPEMVGLGTYEKHELDHAFAPRDVIPETQEEKAGVLKLLTDAGMALPAAMKIARYSPDEIEDQVKQAKDQDAANKRAITEAMKEAEARFNAGEQTETVMPEKMRAVEQVETV
jgi:hypothetical protein